MHNLHLGHERCAPQLCGSADLFSLSSVNDVGPSRCPLMVRVPQGKCVSQSVFLPNFLIPPVSSAQAMYVRIWTPMNHDNCID